MNADQMFQSALNHAKRLAAIKEMTNNQGLSLSFDELLVLDRLFREKASMGPEID